MMGVFLILLLLAVAGVLACHQSRKRSLHRWLLPYVRSTARRGLPRDGKEVHLLLCIADHYEPKWNRATPEVAQGRVERWVQDYPRQFGRFRDSDGRPPRYTFFYPAEEYEPAYLDALADLCRAGFGEVEIHLHHDRDTAEGLRDKLLTFKDLLAQRHGLLGRQRLSGAVQYGFIHGNWALCNGRPDGRFCGVNNELEILRQTGCYADFTFPSAPHATQPVKINSIYYACDQPGQPRSHEQGWDAGKGKEPAGALLLIQGPLVLNWKNRKWGLAPRIENGCLQGSQPPSLARLDNWLRARVQVAGRPDWFFVKLHAHGAQEESQAILLGQPMVQFHEGLAQRARDNPRFHYHYVTAREMFNLVKATEAGWKGSVVEALDYELLFPNSMQSAFGGQHSAINVNQVAEC